MRQNDSKKEIYIKSKIRGQDTALTAIRDKTFSDSRRDIQIDEIEGRILEVLIILSGARKVIEVGTLAGYSTIWMANAVGSEGKIYTIEKNQQHAQLAQQNFIDRANIELIVGDAEKELVLLSDRGPFDMMFVDADKKRYTQYLRWAVDNLRQGGLLVADNTLSFGSTNVFDPDDSALAEVVESFNETIAASNTFSSVILPTANGLTVAVKL